MDNPEIPTQNITKEQKIDLIKLLDAKQQIRKDQNLRELIPTPIQKLILLAKEKVVLILGATRSGKTECLAADLLIRSTGIIPKIIESEYPKEFLRHGNSWLSAISYKFMRDVLQEKLDKLVPRRMLTQFRRDDQIYFLSCGCQIGLKSMEQGWMAFEGASRIYLGFDEEHDEKCFSSGYMRTMDCEGIVRMAFSPLKGLTWAYKQYYLKAHRYYYTTNKHGISEGIGIVHTP